MDCCRPRTRLSAAFWTFARVVSIVFCVCGTVKTSAALTLPMSLPEACARRPGQVYGNGAASRLSLMFLACYAVVAHVAAVPVERHRGVPVMSCVGPREIALQQWVPVV